MKVLKVIVDELPDSCQECKFLDDMTGVGHWCMVDGDYREPPDTAVRPDWCPLMVEGEMVVVIGEPFREVE
jgi:hypothetical protein